MVYTIKCRLAAIQESQYITYVFVNLDEEYSHIMRYLTCTKLPNWNYNLPLKVGDIGFLQCDFVTAGDTYFKLATKKEDVYQYSNCYFVNFIKEEEKIIEKEYIFK